MLVSSHVLAEVAQTADEVVVIARGRSVAQAPLKELLATSAGGMRVAGPDTGRLAELLRGAGAAVDAAGDGAIVVHDRSGEDIGALVAEHRLVISELSPISSSLEEIFFQLTARPGDGRMTRLISSELLKLRSTRTALALIASVVGLVVLIGLIATLTADFEKDDVRTVDLLGIAGFAQVFALILGILAVTTEFRHGTITPTLIVAPDRVRLVMAKLVAHVLAGLSSASSPSASRPRSCSSVLSSRGIDTGLTTGTSPGS